MKSYQEIANDLVELLDEKNAAYGNSFLDTPEILKILYPEGVATDDFENLLTITRILDKIYRIANNDTSEDPWFDIAGYAFLAMRKRAET